MNVLGVTCAHEQFDNYFGVKISPSLSEDNIHIQKVNPSKDITTIQKMLYMPFLLPMKQ